MIYLFTGTDEHKARTKAFAWVEASRKKAPEASYLRVEGKNLNAQAIEELTASQGLFFSKLLVLIDDPFASKAAEELVLEHLDRLADSSNPIAFLAPDISAALEKKLEKHVQKIFHEDIKAKQPARGFNAGLVNALGARDGKKLWLELMKAERAGDAPEMLHGLLHWKARDLMQKGGRGWSREEARTLSVELIALLGDSRQGTLSLSETLEQFALSL